MRTFYFSFIFLAACPYVYAFLFLKKNYELAQEYLTENTEGLKLLKKSVAANCGLTQLEGLETCLVQR